MSTANLYGSTYAPPSATDDEEAKKKKAAGTTAPVATSAPTPTAAPSSMTFAQMQAAGQARPAPPTAAPMPSYTGSAQATTGRDLMQSAARTAAAAPTRYDLGTFTTIRDAALGDMDAQFAQARLGLDESLARRGLYDSSIAANQYRDLGGQQARAVAGLNAQLLQDAAATQMADRMGSAQLAQNLAQLAGSQDLASFEANRVGQAMDFENALRSAQFGEGQRQFDMSQALAEYLGVGGLGLESAKLAQQGEQFGQSLEEQRAMRLQQYGLSSQELDLRATQLQQEAALRGRSLDIDEARNAAEIDLRTQQLIQQASTEGRTLDLQEARQMAEQEQFAATLGQRETEFTRTMDEAALDRLLRERLGLTELSGVYTDKTGQTYNTVARDRLDVEREGAYADMLYRIANLLGLGGLGSDFPTKPTTPPPTTTPTTPPDTTPTTPTTPTDPTEDPTQPRWPKGVPDDELMAALMSILSGGA